MYLALAELELPIRIRPDRPMTDEGLARFCADNDPIRVERDSNGELIVMSPTFSEGGGIESEVGIELAIWARADGEEGISAQTLVLLFPILPFGPPTLHG
jgi:Uma2 family endonuclease